MLTVKPSLFSAKRNTRSSVTNSHYWLILIALSAFLLGGCQTFRNQPVTRTLDGLYQGGLYESAAMTAESKLKLVDAKDALLSVTPQTGKVLLHLEAAENWRLARNPARAIEHFDAVETLLKQSDTTHWLTTSTQNLGAIVTNDSAISYVPTPPERILTNFYKALAFWDGGELENARVEFNRANDRARIAVESYEEGLKKAQEKTQSEEPLTNGRENDTRSTTTNNSIRRQFPEIDQWKVFNDFVNPAVAYINALFLAATSPPDIEKSLTLMRRVRGMVGSHPVIDQDLLELKEQNGLGVEQKAVWIVYESGLSPEMVERHFSFPVFTRHGVVNVGMSLPSLKPRQPNAWTMQPLIFSDNNPIAFSEITHMDRVMQTEFKKRWPTLLTRAIASATTKAIMQDNLARELGPLGNILGFAMSAATTQADTRMWRSMPESWSVARLKASDLLKLNIKYGANQQEQIRLTGDKNLIIYIKQPTTQAKPLIYTLQLTEGV